MKTVCDIFWKKIHTTKQIQSDSTSHLSTSVDRFQLSIVYFLDPKWTDKGELSVELGVP